MRRSFFVLILCLLVTSIRSENPDDLDDFEQFLKENDVPFRVIDDEGLEASTAPPKAAPFVTEAEEIEDLQQLDEFEQFLLENEIDHRKPLPTPEPTTPPPTAAAALVTEAEELDEMDQFHKDLMELGVDPIGIDKDGIPATEGPAEELDEMDQFQKDLLELGVDPIGIDHGGVPATEEPEEELDEFEQFQKDLAEMGVDTIDIDRGGVQASERPTEDLQTTSSPVGLGEIGVFDPHPYPVMESYSQSKTVTVGDSVEFACRAYDIADHLPNWPKHDLVLEFFYETDDTRDLTSLKHNWWIDSFKRTKARPSYLTGRIDITETAEVTAYKQFVQKSDEGWYRCRACVYEDSDHRECDQNNAKFHLKVLKPRGPVDDPVPAGPTQPPQAANLVETPRSSCQVFGDPHVLTFDGFSYNLPASSCDYVIAMDGLDGQWFIYGRMRPCGKLAQGVCLSAITVYAKGDAVELQRGWLLNHNGEKVETAKLEEAIDVGEFEISFKGTTLTVSVLIKGSELYGIMLQEWLHLHWDGLTALTIEAPQTARTQGLCGNNDVDPANDYDVWGTFNKDPVVLSESMKVPYTDSCPVGKHALSMEQMRELCGNKKYKKAQEKCGKIFNAHEFDACEHDKAFYIDACVYDQCKGMELVNDIYPWMVIPKVDKVLVPGCNAAEAYAMKCSLRTWNSDGTVVGGLAMVDWEKSSHLCARKPEKLKQIPKLGCPQSFMEPN